MDPYTVFVLYLSPPPGFEAFPAMSVPIATVRGHGIDQNTVEDMPHFVVHVEEVHADDHEGAAEAAALALARRLRSRNN